MTTERGRRRPARAGRILAGSLSLASTLALVGFMGRSGAATEAASVAPEDEAPPATRTVRRVVVLPRQQRFDQAPAEITVITSPPRVVHRAPAAGSAGPPVTKSRGS